MLTLAFFHIIISLSCWWTGFLFYKYIVRTNENKSVVFFIVSGLILLTAIAQWLILSLPISTSIQAIFFAVLLLFAVLRMKDCRTAFAMLRDEIKTLTLLTKLILLFTWILILMINAGPILMDDTDSYHIQAIKWIQEYGTVPGIANLHERLGFNSSWFNSIALFSLPSATPGSYTALNGTLSWWFVYYLLHTITRLRKTNILWKEFSLFLTLLFAFLLWPLIRGNAASANYDFITTVLVFILFVENFLTGKLASGTNPTIEWVIWPAYLFTIRIINFPLLLISLFALIILFKKKSTRVILLSSTIGTMLIIPFLFRNVLISGYPLYPSLYFNYFNPDWKADPAMIEQLLYYIKYYGRVSTTFMNLEQTAAIPFPSWIPAWFKHLFWFDKLIFLTGLAGLFLSSAWMLVRKYRFTSEIRLFIFVMLISLGCWFFISPDPRFVYGPLLSGVFLFFYSFTSFIQWNKALKLSLQILPVLFVLAIGAYIISKPIRQTEYRNFISPTALPQPPLKTIMLDGMELYVPEKIKGNWNPRCYGSPLPCLYEINPKLRLRGKSIRSGFHLEK